MSYVVDRSPIALVASIEIRIPVPMHRDLPLLDYYHKIVGSFRRKSRVPRAALLEKQSWTLTRTLFVHPTIYLTHFYILPNLVLLSESSTRVFISFIFFFFFLLIF